jgi:hypothetical protein
METNNQTEVQAQPAQDKQELVLLHYTGTKVVTACPMSLDAAKARLGHDITPSNAEATDGYLVVYPDGYESWSPKEVFEEAYHVSETFMDRLEIERDELSQRLASLKAFINSERFAKLDAWAKQPLLHQCDVMSQYLDLVCKRIRLHLAYDSNSSNK